MRTDLIIATDEEYEERILTEEDVTCVPSFGEVVRIGDTYYRVIERIFQYHPELKHLHISDCWVRVKQINLEEMNKIEEMADAYGRENPFTWYDADAEINENTSSPAIAYSDGANAVLKEIEQLVSKFDRNPGYQYNDLYVRMKDKIRELKGE